MVVLVAAILSTAAMLLKPFQEKNISINKMQGILASVNIAATAENAIEIFDQSIAAEIVIDPEGNVVSLYQDGKFEKGDMRAFDINMKEQLYKKDRDQDYVLPVFIGVFKGDSNYIIPLYGKGLWGPIWGNIALGPDCNVVQGVSFDHKSETPGLGAEINTPMFEEQFKGKTIFNEKGEFVSIMVVKGGIGMLPDDEKNHGVDAISGGTITSDGVAAMLDDWLGGYVPFFRKHR
jgi:Na+-transporting NADH:ubiquinone oxidoreductase subunit C